MNIVKNELFLHFLFKIRKLMLIICEEKLSRHLCAIKKKKQLEVGS